MGTKRNVYYVGVPSERTDRRFFCGAACDGWVDVIAQSDRCWCRDDYELSRRLKKRLVILVGMLEYLRCICEECWGHNSWCISQLNSVVCNIHLSVEFIVKHVRNFSVGVLPHDVTIRRIWLVEKICLLHLNRYISCNSRYGLGRLMSYEGMIQLFHFDVDKIACLVGGLDYCLTNYCNLLALSLYQSIPKNRATNALEIQKVISVQHNWNGSFVLE